MPGEFENALQQIFIHSVAGKHAVPAQLIRL
jgi:hypothetical protein